MWWGQGQGGLLATPRPKTQNEICLGTRDWWKTSEFNSKHLEKEGRKEGRNALACVRDRPQAQSDLLSPTLGELH